jgi:hypothetical protein
MSDQAVIEGSLKLVPKLKADQRAYLERFSNTRRMRRDTKVLKPYPDPLRVAVDLPLVVSQSSIDR